MRGLLPMTVANARSFMRDRASLFWTLAFPVLFVVLFGTIFSGGTTSYALAWSDEDGSSVSAQLRSAFGQVSLLEVREAGRDEALELMREGEVDGVIVVPEGLAAAVGGGDGPFALTLFTDPSRQGTSQTIQQIVNQVVSGMNQLISGVPPVLSVESQSLQTQTLSAAAFFVPSILAMALMQLGVFAAVPLVAQREKLILKRLSATPISRATLVGSNVLMRLAIAVVQTVLIIGVGAVLFGVTIVGNVILVAAFIVLGAMTFLAIGYVIGSYARTEEAANSLTSVVQFPLMFLSGIFFPLEVMPEFLQPVAAAMPLTYLGDALRQTMVGGSAYVPLHIDALVLGGWLVACFAISARFFRWQ